MLKNQLSPQPVIVSYRLNTTDAHTLLTSVSETLKIYGFRTPAEISHHQFKDPIFSEIGKIFVDEIYFTLTAKDREPCPIDDIKFTEEALLGFSVYKLASFEEMTSVEIPNTLLTINLGRELMFDLLNLVKINNLPFSKEISEKAIAIEFTSFDVTIVSLF